MGGALALDAAWLFAAFLIILVLAALVIAVRRFLLERGGGTVECGLRKESGSWRLGVASYQREELCWFGVFGVSMRPDEIFPRRDLTVKSRRLPDDAEASTLGPGMVVIECKLGGDSAPGTGSSAGAGAGTDGVPAATTPSQATGAPNTPRSSRAADTPGSPEASGASGAPGPSGVTGRAATVELVMGEAALTGFLAWLEAAPPGSHLNEAR